MIKGAIESVMTREGWEFAAEGWTLRTATMDVLTRLADRVAAATGGSVEKVDEDRAVISTGKRSEVVIAASGAVELRRQAHAPLVEAGLVATSDVGTLLASAVSEEVEAALA